jgi:hypothetical protein
MKTESGEKENPLSTEIWTGHFRRQMETADYMLSCQKKCLRYNEIRREMTNITDTALAATLRESPADEIIVPFFPRWINRQRDLNGSS